MREKIYEKDFSYTLLKYIVDACIRASYRKNGMLYVDNYLIYADETLTGKITVKCLAGNTGKAAEITDGNILIVFVQHQL